MNRNKGLSALVPLVLLCSACASMTPGEKATAVGAAAGAVVGNVVTGGGVLGTLGGAAVGGLIGKETSKK